MSIHACTGEGTGDWDSDVYFVYDGIVIGKGWGDGKHDDGEENSQEEHSDRNHGHRFRMRKHSFETDNHSFMLTCYSFDLSHTIIVSYFG